VVVAVADVLAVVAVVVLEAADPSSPLALEAAVPSLPRSWSSRIGVPTSAAVAMRVAEFGMLAVVALRWSSWSQWPWSPSSRWWRT
jgi:hypothetical protein